MSRQRLDGTPSGVLSVNNTTHRGRYFHLTRNYDTTTGQFARLRNVKVVSP
ncbi:hypothetical protein [Aeromicrobium yanjiei]|uniref:Uncharacterized protein n=1 Tax=Aeromicrobium yanjiei TaxID=2662028 RepID=A0A5Q2MF63_9ACTN|nr:hypothetical protein [Aeromicrobium yanjiei]QGG41774.1 hypothetical protein GEV26_10595 [Aeromicrobium yanjiei]